MNQNIQDAGCNNIYTIYYAAGDLSSLSMMYGRIQYRDSNSVLFKSLSITPHFKKKLRYYKGEKSSKLLSMMDKSDNKYSKDIDVYDCIPWKSTYEIHGFTHHWTRSGTLNLCIPQIAVGNIKTTISAGETTEYKIKFDNTNIDFEIEYYEHWDQGLIRFNNQNISKNNIEINNNMYISEATFVNKDWFNNQVPYPNNSLGFRIHSDNTEEFKKFETV